jgi:hypothetical protein
VANDPRGAAQGEVSLRVDQRTGGVRSDAAQVEGAVRDPEGAAQSRADAKIAEAKAGTTGSASGDVSVSSDGSASVDVDKKK